MEKFQRPAAAPADRERPEPAPPAPDLSGPSASPSSGERPDSRERSDFRERPEPEPPATWAPLADAYRLTDADWQSGLGEALYAARDTAAAALDRCLAHLGVDRSFYAFVADLPVGLDAQSAAAGAYDPGCYGVTVGRRSDAVQAWLAGERDPAGRNQMHLVCSLAHEMLHAVLTGPPASPSPSPDVASTGVEPAPPSPDAIPTGVEPAPPDVAPTSAPPTPPPPAADRPYSLSQLMRTLPGSSPGAGWSALEEGVVETLANVATQTFYHPDLPFQTSLHDFESYCRTATTAPVSAAAAHLLDHMTPAQTTWLLTCAQTGAYPEDQIGAAFGADYPRFLENLSALYTHELADTPGATAAAQPRLAATLRLIDAHFPPTTTDRPSA